MHTKYFRKQYAVIHDINYNNFAINFCRFTVFKAVGGRTTGKAAVGIRSAFDIVGRCVRTCLHGSTVNNSRGDYLVPVDRRRRRRLVLVIVVGCTKWAADSRHPNRTEQVGSLRLMSPPLLLHDDDDASVRPPARYPLPLQRVPGPHRRHAGGQSSHGTRPPRSLAGDERPRGLGGARGGLPGRRAGRSAAAAGRPLPRAGRRRPPQLPRGVRPSDVAGGQRHDNPRERAAREGALHRRSRARQLQVHCATFLHLCPA